MFKPVKPQVSFPELEEETLTYWKENKIFEKSVEGRPEDKRWTFLDGPPFITGMPHYGSLLSSIPKDVFPRFKTMQGYRVRRVWGWDCHGLPAENKVETKLGLKSKREIEEKVGVKKFIDECKAYVSEVSEEWEWYVDHIGRWVDFKNAYKTMELPYMESVLWVFKQMYDKGYIYKGLRVSLYCPHCATPISNFEVAMDTDNYKEITDAATTYKYELVDNSVRHSELGSESHEIQKQVWDDNEKMDSGQATFMQTERSQARMTKNRGKTYILAWSTTPWNKIVTPALAVNPKLEYIKVKQGNEFYILAKSTLKMLHKEPVYEIVEEFKGKELIGLKFEPHYDYYPIEAGEKAFVVVPGDFVTAEEGTGVVTIAAYGEEDLKVMQEHNIHIEMHLDEEGTIKSDVPKFGGMYYLKANKAVNEDLASRGLIYEDKPLPHNVPLCWRCHTRLYYAPQNAWYVNVQELKPLLKKTNEKVNWFPKHFKYGRFLKSLENAPDWNISRSRYWGSPVPVWECECGERFVPGSIKELEEATGQKVADLHKPEIDEIFITCKKCGQKAGRVPEVLDSWIEAGSASFAERHFPFNALEKLEDFYPPDFIAEYTGQIRAWFYVLHVIGGALYGTEAFKNVVVEGVILGTDGRKMSKNYGNYPDPREMLQKYGGDALRLYLMGSPVMHGEDILISEEQYRNQVKGMMLILWNVYNFFVTYANIDKWQPSCHSGLTTFSLHERSLTRINPNMKKNPGRSKDDSSENVLDKWILSLLNGLIRDVTTDLENFDTVNAIAKLQKFVDDLSTWYIRRSRDRVGPTAENEEDKIAFYETCYEALVTFSKLLAPIAPFLAEEIYRNLTKEESVHLAKWPEAQEFDKNIIYGMEVARSAVERAHSQRKQAGIKVRQPLREMVYFVVKPGDKPLEKYENLVKDEVNVKNIVYKLYRTQPDKIKERYAAGDIILNTTISKELAAEGEARDLVRKIQEERKKLGTKLTDHVNVELPNWPEEFTEEIKRKALISNLKKGSSFRVTALHD